VATDKAGSQRQMVARNKRAFHDYAISETYEAGLVLSGTEVKSLRAGRASLLDGYAVVRDGEAWLHNVHIPEYAQGTWTNHPPRQPRKLLLHRKEIRELAKAGQVKGFSLIPLALYFSDGYAKVEIGIGRGKKEYDKRQTLAQRDAQRETDRAVRRRH
jgi:SsrA-binding protein